VAWDKVSTADAGGELGCLTKVASTEESAMLRGGGWWRRSFDLGGSRCARLAHRVSSVHLGWWFLLGAAGSESGGVVSLSHELGSDARSSRTDFDYRIGPVRFLQ